MGERTKGSKLSIRDKMTDFYNIESSVRGTFVLQVDWLLENAVYPLENPYSENLMDLWNIYMPGYAFDNVIVEYSKVNYPVLRYIHDGEIQKFDSTRFLQDCAIKNYMKYCIAQGESNRMKLVKECFDLLKDVTDRSKLFYAIDQVFDHYFIKGEVEQCSEMFLKRFPNYNDQPYKAVLEMLSDIHEQKEQVLRARPGLSSDLNVNEQDNEQFQTLINVFLCRIAMADGEKRFSEVLENTWKDSFSEISYSEKVYSFIEKYEKAYMFAACFGIKNIKDGNVVKQLYKDAVILCAVVQAIENGYERYGLKEVNDFWKNDGMHFAKGYYFDDEYERMRQGFESKILLAHKSDILAFHDILIEKIKAGDFSIRGSFSTNNISGGKRNPDMEIDTAAMNGKERQIDELLEKIAELEEKIDSTEKNVLIQFISLLDSKKYDHVLGKLYRIGYSEDAIQMGDIQRIVKNLFEIMNINGIDAYGELGTHVKLEEIKKGKYRVDKPISDDAEIRYPGYRIGDRTILHPVAEEV